MNRRDPDAELAASVIGDFLSGFDPDAQADLLDALKQDMAEGGSVSVYVPRAPSCRYCHQPVRMSHGQWWARGEYGTGRACNHEPEAAR